GLRVIRGGREDDPEYFAIGAHEWPARVSAAYQRPDRVDLPGHLALLVDVRPDDGPQLAYPGRLRVVRAVQRITDHNSVGAGTRRPGSERQRRRAETGNVDHRQIAVRIVGHDSTVAAAPVHLDR